MPTARWPTYVALTVLWGLSLVAVRGVVGGRGWAFGAVLCALVIAAVKVVVSHLTGEARPLAGSPRRLLILGAAVVIQDLGVCYALDRIGLAQTAVVLAAVPLFATLTGQMLGADRITEAAATGLGTGFVGVLLVAIFPADGGSWNFIGGVLAGLVAALTGGFSIRYAALRFPGRAEPMAAAHGMAAVVALPLVILSGSSGSGSAWSFLWLVLLAVALGAAGVLTAQHFPVPRRALRMTRVKNGGLVVAVLVGVCLQHETLSMGQVLGLVLLMIGATLVLELVPEDASARWLR
ncbi:MAG: hypothetical protein QM779_04745 [Propionicimonas sp.]|uniref:hypothetical protein n=1 Tax=Propionicimonas sp. TaxID=1955623 RepID=UPI003D0C11EB